MTRVWNGQIVRRAEIVLEWLDQRTTGASIREIHAATQTGTADSTQRLLKQMADRNMIVVAGGKTRFRCATPRHAATAGEAATEHVMSSRRRRVLARQEMEAQKRRALMQRPGNLTADEVYQVVVKEWPKPKVVGPRSVFEIATA